VTGTNPRVVYHLCSTDLRPSRAAIATRRLPTSKRRMACTFPTTRTSAKRVRTSSPSYCTRLPRSDSARNMAPRTLRPIRGSRPSSGRVSFFSSLLGIWLSCLLLCVLVRALSVLVLNSPSPPSLPSMLTCTVLLNQTPPIIPKIDSPTDTRNFRTITDDTVLNSAECVRA